MVNEESHISHCTSTPKSSNRTLPSLCVQLATAWILLVLSNSSNKTH